MVDFNGLRADAHAMIRIIAGEYRTRQLEAPRGEEVTRPILNRVRESVFNLLRGWLDGAHVLDLFAGVGTIGLEAASRGASQVLMVEQDRRIHSFLQRNIETLGCGDRVEALHGDALSPVCLIRAPAPVDLIFVDPPYAMMREEGARRRVLDQIEACRAIMGDTGFVVLRTPILGDDTDLAVSGFDGPETHGYGREMRVCLYAPRTG